MGIRAVFVPQGAEYQAVCRGLRRVEGETPPVFATPAGVLPIQRYLTTWLATHSPGDYGQVLLMGLCGGLSPAYQVGDGVVYSSCLSPEKTAPQGLACWGEVALFLPRVRGITRDRVITTATEKQGLYQQYQAEVVDMEGYPVLAAFNQVGIQTAMVRVVSDDCHHDIPNLEAAFDTEGRLQPLPVVSSFIRQPVAAVRLIQGARKGLQSLEEITTALWA